MMPPYQPISSGLFRGASNSRSFFESVGARQPLFRHEALSVQRIALAMRTASPLREREDRAIDVVCTYDVNNHEPLDALVLAQNAEGLVAAVLICSGRAT